MTSTPTPKTTRVSVPVTPEVLAKFQRFSEASGLSLGKSMGDWLRDTAAGLDAMTEILEMHKRAPAEAIAKFQGLATSLQAVTSEALENMKRPSPRAEGGPARGGERAAETFRKAAQALPSLIPPSGNTGGKGTKAGTGKAGGHASAPRSK